MRMTPKMTMAQTNLEKEIRLAEKAQATYRDSLNALIPVLLDTMLPMMRQKRVAIQLTGIFDNDGAYLPYNVKRPSAVYMAFPEGIVKVETNYDKKGLPQTREIPVSKEEYLRWDGETLERAQDTYRRLRDYSEIKPFEAYFPSDDVI